MQRALEMCNNFYVNGNVSCAVEFRQQNNVYNVHPQILAIFKRNWLAIQKCAQKQQQQQKKCIYIALLLRAQYILC